MRRISVFSIRRASQQCPAGPKTALHEYNGRENHSLYAGDALYREGKDVEERGAARARTPGQWRTPIYHSTDFSETRCSMSLPRRRKAEILYFGFATLFCLSGADEPLPIVRFDFYGNLLSSKKFFTKILCYFRFPKTRNLKKENHSYVKNAWQF